jgi:hypothetical protein
MNSYTETTQASYRDAAGLPTRRRWQILVGVTVAVILTVATVVFVNESDPPVVDQPLQPVAQSQGGVGEAEGLVGGVPEVAVDSATTPLRSAAISAFEAREIAFAKEFTISGYYGQPEAGSLTEPHVPMANNQMR